MQKSDIFTSDKFVSKEKTISPLSCLTMPNARLSPRSFYYPSLSLFLFLSQSLSTSLSINLSLLFSLYQSIYLSDSLSISLSLSLSLSHFHLLSLFQFPLFPSFICLFTSFSVSLFCTSLSLFLSLSLYLLSCFLSLSPFFISFFIQPLSFFFSPCFSLSFDCRCTLLISLFNSLTLLTSSE